jgi:hypothetical protein
LLPGLIKNHFLEHALGLSNHIAFQETMAWRPKPHGEKRKDEPPINNFGCDGGLAEAA